MREMRALGLAVALASAAILAGCGDDASPVAGGSPTTTPPSGAGEGSPDTSTDQPSGSDLAPGTGFIQVGDLRHELTVELCANLFGGVNGRAVGASDPEGVSVVFNLAPEDWEDAGGNFDEPGSVQYSESQTASWTTGQKRYIDDYELPADIDPATIAITSYSIADDGASVTGEATFYDLNALVYATPVAPEVGSFGFACPAD